MVIICTKLAIHWRYSRGDWFNHCKTEGGVKYGGSACTMAEKLIENPKVVAQLLAELVREQHQLNVTTIRVIAKHIHFVGLFEKTAFYTL